MFCLWRKSILLWTWLLHIPHHCTLSAIKISFLHIYIKRCKYVLHLPFSSCIIQIFWLQGIGISGIFENCLSVCNTSDNRHILFCRKKHYTSRFYSNWGKKKKHCVQSFPNAVIEEFLAELAETVNSIHLKLFSIWITKFSMHMY